MPRRTPSLVRRDVTDGYPTDYLLARIRGRRTALITDWRGPVAHARSSGASDERIWEALLRELEWLHSQMNPGLRETFAPLFGLFEIKTIVLCLRNRAIHRTNEIERLLERSLLDGRLREILLRQTDVRSTVVALAGALGDVATAFGELEGAYAEGGLKGFESELTRLYLQHLATERLHPAIKTYFVFFIDLRNIMLLYKHLRWAVGGDGSFISGGSVEAERLQMILARKDATALDDLVTGLTGLKRIPDAAREGSLETVLLKSMTSRLQEIRREADGIALILEYVWRIYIQARNLAVLHHGETLDVPTLERELIV